MTTKEEVQVYLTRVKETIAGRNPDKGWLVRIEWKRDINKATMTELGFTPADVLSTVMDLQVEDYTRGPVDDVDEERRGIFWIFGKTLKGIEVYIKLRLTELSKLRTLKIVSFHRSDRPMRYPFR
jgi:hypothetical protein